MIDIPIVEANLTFVGYWETVEYGGRLQPMYFAHKGAEPSYVCVGWHTCTNCPKSS